MDVIVPYEPFPKQRLFHESPALYRLFGGAAGPGKTEAVLMEAVTKCLKKDKPMDGILFRRTFPELEMSLIKRFRDKIPSFLYRYDATKHVAHFYNGRILQFGYCDNETDVYRYQSAEYDFIGVDELTHFNEFFFAYITSRLRTAKPNVTPSFFAGTNPGNVGHAWVKARWIDKNCTEPGYDPNEYDCVEATIYDNPVLLKSDPGYLKRLENLPVKERKALLEGSWDFFEGQYFTEFSRLSHVVKPFTPKYEYPRYGNIDWGRTAPFAFYASAVQNVTHEETVFHRLWTYKEFYGVNKNPKDWAQEIMDNVNLDLFVEIRADLSMFKKKEDGSRSIADDFKEVWGKNGFKLKPADNDRLSGWIIMHNWLSEAPDGFPYWMITDNCTNLIRTLPQLIHDRHKVEDLDSAGEDHAADSMRYGLKHLRWIDAKVGAIKPKQTAIRYKPAIMQTIDLSEFWKTPKKERDWRNV